MEQPDQHPYGMLTSLHHNVKPILTLHSTDFHVEGFLLEQSYWSLTSPHAYLGPSSLIYPCLKRAYALLLVLFQGAWSWPGRSSLNI